jgi:GntR family transcriptional regulator / MocR family aminotransferase
VKKKIVQNAAAIGLNKKFDVPLYRQFYEVIRTAILNRQFPPGYRLPATRASARENEVSRNTITAAYEQLVAR